MPPSLSNPVSLRRFPSADLDDALVHPIFSLFPISQSLPPLSSVSSRSIPSTDRLVNPSPPLPPALIYAGDLSPIPLPPFPPYLLSPSLFPFRFLLSFSTPSFETFLFGNLGWAEFERIALTPMTSYVVFGCSLPFPSSLHHPTLMLNLILLNK